MIKLGQVREVIHAAYYRPPAEARRAFYIFTCSAFMKEAANSLLKVLEEPPERTSIDSADGKPARTAADDSVEGNALPAGSASGGGDRDFAGRAQTGVKACSSAHLRRGWPRARWGER